MAISIYLPTAIAYYTYANLVAAFNKYPFPTYPPISAPLEWAAFFGQTAHESGNFCYINEFGAQSLPYCVETPDYPCYPGAKYFGRGPIQLSYNYNYGPFSEAWFNGNKSVLLTNPDLVGQNGVTGWGSGLWFWATQWTNTYLVTCHIALNAYGYGGVTRVINGIECAPQPDARQVSRVNYFKKFLNVLNVPIPPEDTLYCYSLQPPPTAAPGPTPTQLPTQSPTKMPALPTNTPTQSPTRPTPSPTQIPTFPTPGPSPQPTRPTSSPTPSPTRMPSSPGAWEGWATTTQVSEIRA